MSTDPKARFVTVTELADKLNALRWEIRTYVLVIVLVFILKFQVPQSVSAFAWHLIN